MEQIFKNVADSEKPPPRLATHVKTIRGKCRYKACFICLFYFLISFELMVAQTWFLYQIFPDDIIFLILTYFRPVEYSGTPTDITINPQIKNVKDFKIHTKK